MTKTIEEAARDYAANANVTSENFCPEDITDAFEYGAWCVKDLFFRDRLTAEEKERVRKGYANTYPNDIDCGVENILIQGVLERIFSADFFKEGGCGGAEKGVI